jgi:hypothetical protein
MPSCRSPFHHRSQPGDAPVEVGALVDDSLLEVRPVMLETVTLYSCPHPAVRGAGAACVEPGVGRLMRSLFERRSRADYGLGETPVDEATQAIADANSVVAALGRWMKTPVTPDDEGTD